MDEDYMLDSDRLVSAEASDVEYIPVCGDCYLFGACSSKNADQRADDCFVALGEIESVCLDN